MGILAGLIGLVALFAIFDPGARASTRAPHVGDVYECQLDSHEGNSEPQYGLARIEAIDGEQVTLVASAFGYANRGEAHAAFAAHRWKDTAFLDTGHPFQLSREQLEQFLRSGRVFNIWRED